MMKSRTPQKDRSIIMSIVGLGIPMVLANLLQSAYQITDTLWVGRLGKDALAAVSVSFPITFVAIALAAGFTIAGTTLVAQYMGAKKVNMVNHVAAQTMLMVIVVSCILSAVGYTLTPILLGIMNVEPQVFESAQSFMHMSFIGLIFVFGFSTFQALMRGIGEAKLPLYIVLGTVLINIFLDPLFIFGLGPIPAMGVSGAALATIVTQSLACIIGFIVLFGGKFDIRLEAKHFIPDLKFIKRAFFLGLPSSIEMSTRGLGMAAMTFLVAGFGTVTISAYGIGTNILQLVVIPALGLSMATATLVGQSIGAKDIPRAEAIIRISNILSFAALTIIGGITFVCAPLLAGAFVPGETEVINNAVTFIRIMAWSFGCIGIQMSLIGVFRASGQMVTAMVLTLISQWIFQFPIAYALSQFTSLGKSGLWWTFPITNAFMAIITILWFLRGTWKKGNLTEDTELQGTTAEETYIEAGARS